MKNGSQGKIDLTLLTLAIKNLLTNFENSFLALTNFAKNQTNKAKILKKQVQGLQTNLILSETKLNNTL